MARASACLILLLCVLCAGPFAGCRDSTPPATQAATRSAATAGAPAKVKFTPVGFKSAAKAFGVEQQSEYGFDLDLSVYAISKDVAFLWGEMSVPMGTAQSTLLRTSDGGQHWVEVMEPVPGSSVTLLQMNEDGIGWALTMWQVEGPGELQLFHTRDSGQHWLNAGPVPKPETLAYPVQMIFADDKHVLIDMVYDQGAPNDGLTHMITNDGGKTWHSCGFVPATSVKLRNRRMTEKDRDAWGKLMEHYGHESGSRLASDGSEWKVERPEDSGQILVSRRLKVGEWAIVSILPDHFNWNQGRIEMIEH